MSDVQQFHSLQRFGARLLRTSWLRLPSCPRQTLRLRRHMPRIACSLLMLASATAYAQCPVQPAYPPQPTSSQDQTESTESALHKDVRASIAAQKSGRCQSAKLFQKRILSKEDLQELRRVVREHAKSRPLHNTADSAKP